jgi:anti-anti-sigma regulatory factor
MAIIKKLQRNGKVVVLCSVQPYVMEKFKKSGIIEQVGEKNIINNISDFKC